MFEEGQLPGSSKLPGSCPSFDKLLREHRSLYQRPAMRLTTRTLWPDFYNSTLVRRSNQGREGRQLVSFKICLMKRTTIVIFAVTMLLSVFQPGNAGRIRDIPIDTADFTLVKTERGISLYERWYPITSTENARQIKATFTVRANSTDALSLLKDDSKGELWNKNTNDYRVVDVRGDSWVSYIQYDLPWPVKNQDCVLRYDTRESTDDVSVTFQNTNHPAFPVKSRVQRIPEIEGKWIFKRSEDVLHVEYYIATTPSKTLPGWVTDPIIRNNLVETLHVFRKILETRDASN
jgi:hypothetical protein